VSDFKEFTSHWTLFRLSDRGRRDGKSMQHAWREEKCMDSLLESLKKTELLEHTETDERIILKYILKKPCGCT
jgi:hypothetical protein